MRMVDEDIQPGQRWVSDAEPELGLGVVMSAGNGRVSILFPAADDRREYALDSAPVRRVAFEVGDNLKTHDGISGSIEEVKEEGGFLHYQVKGEGFPKPPSPIPSVFQSARSTYGQAIDGLISSCP